MGARTGDENPPVAGENCRMAHGKNRLSSSLIPKKCLSRPGRNLPPSTAALSFIKVMIGPFKEALIIPPKLCPMLKCLLDCNVCLEDSEMQSYLVKLSIFNNALAFRHGWDQFLSDHSIKYGEIVVFKYTEGSKFSVQIFGVSGCERTQFPRSCETNSKRKLDLIEPSCDNILHRKNKTFDTTNEHHTLSLDTMTREMPSDIALDFSNSEQPSCGAVTETCGDGCIPEESGVQQDNRTKPKAVNCETTFYDGAIAEPNINNDIHEKCGIHDDHVEKLQTCSFVEFDTRTCDLEGGIPEKPGVQYDETTDLQSSFVGNCYTKPCHATERESNVDSNITEKSQVQKNNLRKPEGYSATKCNTTPCKLTVKDPITVHQGKTGSINVSMGSEEETENQDNSFYYTCIDLTKGSEVAKLVGLKTSKIKGSKSKIDPFKRHLQPANTSVKSGNMFMKDSYTETEAKKVGSVEFSSMNDEPNCITENSSMLGFKEGKPLCDSDSGNPDKLAVTAGKVFLDAEKRQEQNKCSNPCTHTANRIASSVDLCIDSGSHSSCMKEPENRQNIQNCAAKSTGNSEVDKIPHVKEYSCHCSNNSTVRHNSEAAVLLSDCDPEQLMALDGRSCRFVVNEEGICFLVEQDLVLEENLSAIIPIEIDVSDMGIERCRKFSTNHHFMSKSPFMPQVEQSTNDGQFTCHTNKANEKKLDSLVNPVVVPKIEEAECVDDPVTEPSKSPGNHEKAVLAGGSSELVTKEALDRLAAPKGTDGSPVHVESVDPIVLSSPRPVKLIFSVTVVAQPWLELRTALALKGKKDGRKVVTLRDPCMRTWPILYRESLGFVGFLGGWSALASANNLQPGDGCELEVLTELDIILLHIKKLYKRTLISPV